MNFKLGKLPFKEDSRDLKLKDYIDKDVLPTPPDSTNDYTAFVDWLMFLNDTLGCCGIAGLYHLLMLWIKQGGKIPEIEDANVLKVYEDISGYNPDDPSTDVGVNLRDVLSYWKNTGVPDKNGILHKIGAYVLLNRLDHLEVKIAQYLFSGLYIGFNVPAFVMKLAQQGKLYWDVQDTDIDIEGGHCVIPAGYGKFTLQVVSVSKEGVYFISWGKVYFMTWDFWDTYVDEVWCILDEEFLNNGKSPDGFDLTQLQKDLADITNPNDEPTIIPIVP
jgi:hypothetical protein